MKVNKLIDHTYLKAFGTKKEIDLLLKEAKEYDFKSVCVNPVWVEHARKALDDSDVLVCTVIGFPLGANTTATKVFETKDALHHGADEIDMVLNIGKAREHDYDFIEEEVRAVKEACGSHTLKVILETCYLSADEIKECSKACYKAGADFVKTSTGFGTGGAEVDHVKIMKDVYHDREVKASGGIRSIEDVQAMVDAGASRIGASSGVSIMNGLTSKSDY